MDQRIKYQLLYEQVTSPQSVEHGRETIYYFEKYCRHCGEGLIEPGCNVKKIKVLLWNRGYCSPKCRELGPRKNVQGNCRAGLGERLSFQPARVSPVEEMAFIALRIKREDETESKMQHLIRTALNSFRLISEKLRFLEIETGDRWYKSKWYYWLDRLKLSEP